MSFQKKVENFVCEKCGRVVAGTGYTNHCPECLYSKHVDVNPGDRAETCLGLMKPIGIEISLKNTKIFHKCMKCGKVQKNKTAPDDNQEEIVRISNLPVKI